MYQCPDCGYLAVEPLDEGCPRCLDALPDGPLEPAFPEDRPTPHYPCPECAGVFWTVTVAFERGQWTDEGYEHFDPPMLLPSATGTEAMCVNCGHEVDMATALTRR